MIIYGSSGVGEPEYAGAIYSADVESLELATAPVVELGLEYDPAPQVRYAAIPGWLLLLVGAGFLANWAGMRIGGR